MKRISFFIFMIFILSSCSLMKSKKEVDVERTIASIEPNQLKVDRIDGNLFVSINFEVFSKNLGDNSFIVKLPQNLKNDLKHDLPYDIFINSNNIRCVQNSFLKEVEKNYHYRSTGYLINDELRCLYEGDKDKKIISLTYVFHQLKNIPLAKANSYIQPVNNEAKDAYRILKEVQKGNSVNYFDERLVYDVFADKEEVRFSAQHGQYPIDYTLHPNDLIRIENPRGKIDIPGLGEVDYQGKKTRKFKRSKKAGIRYVIRKEIKPYELFCEVKYRNGRNALETFKWSESIDIYNAKSVKCSLNTKNILKRRAQKIKGEISVEVSYVRYKTLRNKIEKYLKEPQKNLNLYISNLNNFNLTHVKKAAQKTIDLQVQKINKEQVLSQIFAFSIEKDFYIKRMDLIHKPHIRRMNNGEKIFHYLDYHIYANAYVIDEKNNEDYQLGKIFLGKIQTSKLIDPKAKLSDYEIFQGVCGEQYVENYLPYFQQLSQSDAEGKQDQINYDEYTEQIKSFEGYLCDSKLSQGTSLVLRRRNLELCGEEQSQYNQIKAFYDLFEGTHGRWSLEHYVLYPQTHFLEKTVTEKTNKDIKEFNKCRALSHEKALEYIK